MLSVITPSFDWQHSKENNESRFAKLSKSLLTYNFFRLTRRREPLSSRELKLTTRSIRMPKMPLSRLEETPRLQVNTTFQLRPNSFSLSELRVWTRFHLSQERSFNCWDWTRSTLPLSSSSPRLPWSCWSWLILMLFSDTHLSLLLENWSTREVSVRSTSKELPCTTTLSLKRLWDNTVLFPSKTWSMRFTLLVLTSSRPTTSCGHSSCPILTEVGVLEEDSSTSSRVVLLVTESNTSMLLLRRWSKRELVDGFLPNLI